MRWAWLGLLALACDPLPFTPACSPSAAGTACTPRLALSFHLDPAFTAEEAEAIASAAALWEAASGGAVRLELGAVGESEIHRGGVGLPGMIGVTRGREIWLSPLVTRATLEAAAAHELGHALGLGHSKDPASIMFASVRPCARIGASDLAALGAVLP